MKKLILILVVVVALAVMAPAVSTVAPSTGSGCVAFAADDQPASGDDTWDYWDWFVLWCTWNWNEWPP